MLCVINADAAGLKILKAKYRPGFSPGLFSIKKTTCRATFPATDLKKVYDGEKEKIKNPLKRDREKRRRKENADAIYRLRKGRYRRCVEEHGKAF